MSEPLRKRRKRSDVIKTGVQLLPRDKPGECLPIGQAVTGVEVNGLAFSLEIGCGGSGFGCVG